MRDLKFYEPADFKISWFFMPEISSDTDQTYMVR